MPRRLRHAAGGYVYHVLNRAVGRATLFHKDGDYAAFRTVLIESQDWIDVPLLGYCLMANHWHLVLWPKRDGDLSEYLRWLTVTHTQRWHAHYHSQGTGPVYQGRFKSFPIAEDEHLLTVLRYVERNPLRAGLVASAGHWRWSSLGQGPLAFAWPSSGTRSSAEAEGLVGLGRRRGNGAELEALRRSVSRGTPYGSEVWQQQTAKALGLQASLHPISRPPKSPPCV